MKSATGTTGTHTLLPANTHQGGHPLIPLMPPRISPSTSRGGSRGGYQRGGGIRAQGPPAPSASSHITTIGVKRTSFGTSGVARTVLTNHFPVSIPDDLIFHYDGQLLTLLFIETSNTYILQSVSIRLLYTF